MKISKKLAALCSAFAVMITMSGCAAAPRSADKDDEYDITESLPEESGGNSGNITENDPAEERPETPEAPEEEPKEEEPAEPAVPEIRKISYLNVKADGVNIRSGAGTGYTARGVAEKSTMYAFDGTSDGWYKTGYKNKTAYISAKYCNLVEMAASENEKIETVIAEGTKLLGTAYVFGAVRYHDGTGRLLKNFTTGEFDCSSLMQYIFYKGAQVNLQVNTRTQVFQGKTVGKSDLKRGDLMFFTNASRKNNKGVERIGHVALYLGDNWILHTASDYAKIEQISATRWGYFIQAQRIL